MTDILITDPSKSGLVMTSEVIKDLLSNVIVTTANCGKECLEKARLKAFDLIIVDFDLPDSDGTSVIQHLREFYFGPILLTAFPEKIVEEAIEKELFFYKDVSDWIRKPVKYDDLAKKIDRFLIQKERLKKRFQTKLPAIATPKSAGKGKKTPKVVGNVINLSINGALLSSAESQHFKQGMEVTLTLDVKKSIIASAENGKKGASKTKEDLVASPQIKAKVVWTNKPKKQVGLSFDKMSELNRQILEKIMRDAKEI